MAFPNPFRREASSGQRTINQRGLRTSRKGMTRMRDDAMAAASQSIRDLGIADSEKGMRDLARSSGGPFKVGVMADAIKYMRELGIDDGAERLADAARGQGVQPTARSGAPGDPPRRRRSDAGKPRPKSRTRPVEASTT